MLFFSMLSIFSCMNYIPLNFHKWASFVTSKAENLLPLPIATFELGETCSYLSSAPLTGFTELHL